MSVYAFKITPQTPPAHSIAIAVTSPNSNPTRTLLRKRKRKDHDQVQVKYIHRVERILLIAMFLAFSITTSLWAPSFIEKELIWNSLVNETNTSNAMSTFDGEPPAIDGNIYLYILPYPSFGSKASLFDCYTLNLALVLRCLAPGFVALILGLTGLALEIHDNYIIDEPFDRLALKVSIRQLLRLSFQYHMAKHRESVLFQFKVGSHRSLSPFGGDIVGIDGGSGKRNNHSPLRKTSLWGQLKKENGLSPSPPEQQEPEENREKKKNENGNDSDSDSDKNIMVTPASKLQQLLHIQILKYRRIVNRRRFRPSELIIVGGFFTTTAMILVVFVFLTTIAIVYSL